MQKQIGAFMDIYLSPYLCGYRKGFNAQHALLSLIGKWRISLDKRAMVVQYEWTFPKHFLP